MISEIKLNLFKCFQTLTLPLRPLTLLSGANASGKSTVLQALVLLHQTILEREWSTRLHLNGGEIQLGNVSDVVDKVFGRREFGIGIADGECAVQWRFDFGDRKQDMSAPVDLIEFRGGTIRTPDRLRFLMPDPPSKSLADLADLAGRLKRLTYITAERVGPRETYQLQDPGAIQLVGPRGENAVGLLHLMRDQMVLSRLITPPAPPALLNQVEARMQRFFPGVTLQVQQVPQTNIVTLGLRTSDATGFHRPVNVGFGLTQILPIVVAALAAAPKDILLVENPEVHLHPAGQAMMGQFLAQIAAAGVQVIAESHSDHVLNGIRRSVKGKVLDPSEVALHFFRPRGGEGDQVVSPSVDIEGNIDVWPEGFFDQLDKDMNCFAGWGE